MICWRTRKFLHYIKQLDSMLPCVCSVKDHRRHQNVVGTSVTAVVTCLMACVSLFRSYHMLSSVIYYWTYECPGIIRNLLVKHAGTGKTISYMSTHTTAVHILVVNGKLKIKSFSCSFTHSFWESYFFSKLVRNAYLWASGLLYSLGWHYLNSTE